MSRRSTQRPLKTQRIFARRVLRALRLTSRGRTIALGLASIGLATAAITMGQVWSSLDSTRDGRPALMWPLPALYLMEVVVLAAIVLLAVVAGRNRHASFVACAALGALSSMALLGAMTIGSRIALALVFLLPASIIGHTARSRNVSHQVAGFVCGVFLQAGVMFSVIQYFLRRPMSGPPAG